MLYIFLLGSERYNGILFSCAACGYQAWDRGESDAENYEQDSLIEGQRGNVGIVYYRLEYDIDSEWKGVGNYYAEYTCQRADDECFGVEEMADVLMYYNDTLLRYGITAEEISKAYIEKHERNMGRDYAGEYDKKYKE